MTEQGINELAGKKVSNMLPTLSLSKPYTTPLPQIYPPPTENPTPSSLIENLKHFKSTDSVFQKTGFAKIGHAIQCLITSNPKALFKRKSLRDRVLGGEQEPLPRFIQKGFEWNAGFLPLDSYNSKECSNDEDLSKRRGESHSKEKVFKCSKDDGFNPKVILAKVDKSIAFISVMLKKAMD